MQSLWFFRHIQRTHFCWVPYLKGTRLNRWTSSWSNSEALLSPFQLILQWAQAQLPNSMSFVQEISFRILKLWLHRFRFFCSWYIQRVFVDFLFFIYQLRQGISFIKCLQVVKSGDNQLFSLLFWVVSPLLQWLNHPKGIQFCFKSIL